MPESSNERVTLQIAIAGYGATVGAAEVNRATDKIKKGAREADVAVDKLEKEMNSLSKTARSLAGPLTTVFAGLSAVQGLRVASRVIADFETTMVTLGGVARATDEEMARLQKTARDFGASTRFSATEAGEGLLFLARAGFSTTDSIAALGATLDLAQAGGIDLGTAADFASNIVSQFGLSAAETVRVVDDLVVVANRANTNVNQMAQAMVFAGPVSQALGVSLETTAGAIGALGDAGIQSTKAGRGLRGVMLALAGPTTEAQKIFKKLDIELSAIDPTANDLSDVLTTLADANIAAGDAAKIFGRENVGAALVLTNSIDKLRQLEQAQKDNIGEANALARMQEDTLGGATKELASATQELILRMGDGGLKSAMRDVVDISTDLVRALGGIENEADPLSDTMKFMAFQVKAVAISLAVMTSAQIITSTIRLARSMQLLRTAITGINVALARNPFTAIALGATFAIVEISGLVSALRDTGDEMQGLRGDVFDFKNALDQLEGIEGVVNRAFSLGEPELIRRGFDNVKNVLITEAESLNASVSAKFVKLGDLSTVIPSSIQDRLKVSTRDISAAFAAEREITVGKLRDEIGLLEEELTYLEANEANAEFIINDQILKLQGRIREIGDTPLSEALVPRKEALAFIEDAITKINVAMEEQKELIDEADNSDNSGAGVLEPAALSEALDDMQALRDELQTQITLVNKNAAETVQYENSIRAAAAAANVPFLQRVAFLIEINMRTNELLDAQRALAASDIISAQKDEIEILKLKKEGLSAEAELLRQTIALRAKGIELTAGEKEAILELIRTRQELEGSASGGSRIDDLFRELEFEKDLIGLTNDERERAIRLREFESAAIQAQVPNVEELTAQYKKSLEELQNLRDIEQFNESLKTALGDTLADVALKAETAEDAFKSLYQAVQRLFFQRFVSDPLTDALDGFLDGVGSSGGGGSQPGIFGGLFADGGAFTQGGYQVRLAGGDILTGPTALSTARGPALGGEAGPEAIMPLKRDGQGRLGVVAEGGGGARNITVNMNFSGTQTTAEFEESARQAAQRLRRTLRNV